MNRAMAELDIAVYGWRYLRVEIWRIKYIRQVNVLYGIKILRFKIFVGAT